MRIKFLRKKSFSLIEILVVLSLFFLLLVLGLPHFSFFERFLLKAETEKLYTIIIFLQQRSIASGQNQRLVLNTAENSYSYGVLLHNNRVCSSHESVKLVEGYGRIPLRKTSTHFFNKNVIFGFLENAKGPPAEPKKLIKISVTFPKVEDVTKNYTVVFWVDGKISPGTIYLRSKKKNYMTAITCPISQVSLIRKYYYNDNRWILEN